MRQLFTELKRRKVYRVAATYAVVGFVVIEAADLIFPALRIPDLAYRLVVILVILGFPIALVLAWAFEVTPEGVHRTDAVDGEEAASTTEGRPSGAASRLAGKVLVGLGFAGLAVAGGWYLVGAGGESPEVTEGTVAVLPFEVSGTAADEWRDGMVSLLSNGLDGAGSLRAIADRTVFAEWKAAGMSPSGTSSEKSLAVARALGAEHAVIGSAATLGDELQLAADVHATQSGERVDRVDVSGSPDSVAGLADQLAQKIIEVLAAEAGLAPGKIAVAGKLTDSPEALKLYLSGLEHERVPDPEAAIEDYREAIRLDSTFALPYARIGFLGVWVERARGDALRRAHELSDQLPERERRLVRALHLGRIEHRTLAAADSLRRLTYDYPDDPAVWRTLGEVVLHEGIANGWLESEEAHERALQLDPQNTGHYSHYVEPAFVLHHDSALAAQRVAEIPDGQMKELFRLGLEAVFGTEEARERAVARYDTVSIPIPWMAITPLFAPEDVDLYDEVLRRLLERDDLDPSVPPGWLLMNDLRRGRPGQFLRDVEQFEPESETIAELLLLAAVNGVPMPDSLTRRYLAPEHLPAEPSLWQLELAALYEIELGDLTSVGRLLDHLRSESGADAYESSARREAMIQELEGLQAWKQGDLERAARLLSRSNESGITGALWRGDLYRELGELETAERWYRVWLMPIGTYERLGQLYEEMDRPEDAADAYRRFVAAWDDADEPLQPRVEAARARIRALEAKDAEPGD